MEADAEADAGAGAEAASSSLKSVRRGPLAEDEEEDEEEDDDEEADGATEEEVVVVEDEDAVSVASLDLLATGHGGPDDVASPAPCCVERPLERPRRSTTRPTTTAPVAPAATMSETMLAQMVGGYPQTPTRRIGVFGISRTITRWMHVWSFILLNDVIGFGSISHRHPSDQSKFVNVPSQ